jgi:hypothetical protein
LCFAAARDRIVGQPEEPCGPLVESGRPFAASYVVHPSLPRGQEGNLSPGSNNQTISEGTFQTSFGNAFAEIDLLEDTVLRIWPIGAVSRRLHGFPTSTR